MSKSRKSKVIAIAFEEPNGLARVQEGDQEPKTDAEQMSDLINVIATDESQNSAIPPPQDDMPILTTELSDVLSEAEAKPKCTRATASKEASRNGVAAKRSASKAPPLRRLKTTAVEAEPEPEPEPESPQEEVNADVKSAEKVECPDCGKKMSAKTLKYSHTANCTVRKKNNQENNLSEVTKDLIEMEVSKRMNNVEEQENFLPVYV